MLDTFIINFIQLLNEASPWLLLGLLIAGLMKILLPTTILSEHLGQGKSAIVKAALIGAPLPLCSCGVIPVATTLSRSGASKPATAAFLVATPETGVDSISVSYALLGPVFAIFRPIAAISSAIITGLLVLASDNQRTNKTLETISSANKPSSCCSSKSAVTSPQNEHQPNNITKKVLRGIHYAATRLIDDLIIWLTIGLIFAALIKTFVPTEFLLSYGSGLMAMLVMILISIPMYICATASTPIAAGFILAGISPGTALVFMMAGPATNISTLGVIKNELGTRTLISYLAGVSLSAIGFGFLLDWLVSYYALDVSQQMLHHHDIVPSYIAISCSALLVFLALKPIRQLFFKTLH